MKMKPKIIVCIERGLVQAIYAENFDEIPDVEVIDFDNDLAEEDDTNLVKDRKRVDDLDRQIETGEAELLY